MMKTRNDAKSGKAARIRLARGHVRRRPTRLDARYPTHRLATPIRRVRAPPEAEKQKKKKKKQKKLLFLRSSISQSLTFGSVVSVASSAGAEATKAGAWPANGSGSVRLCVLGAGAGAAALSERRSATCGALFFSNRLSDMMRGKTTKTTTQRYLD
jgi:hypothetical protein